MTLASTVQSSAYRAVKTYGAKGTLTQITNGVYNPATGTTSPVTVIANVSALMDATSLKTLGFKFGDGLIQSGDIQATIAAKGLPFVPGLGNVLAVPQGTFTVRDSRPEWIGADAVIYNLLVRR